MDINACMLKGQTVQITIAPSSSSLAAIFSLTGPAEMRRTVQALTKA
jgi:hypothetical protein